MAWPLRGDGVRQSADLPLVAAVDVVLLSPEHHSDDLDPAGRAFRRAPVAS